MEGQESIVNIPEHNFFVQIDLFSVGLCLDIDAAQFLQHLDHWGAWRWLYTYVSKNEPIFIFIRNTQNSFPTLGQPGLLELWLKPTPLLDQLGSGLRQLKWLNDAQSWWWFLSSIGEVQLILQYHKNILSVLSRFWNERWTVEQRVDDDDNLMWVNHVPQLRPWRSGGQQATSHERPTQEIGLCDD